MLRLFLALGLASLTMAQASPSAQATFAERRALLEADRACRYFNADVRAALQAGALQARGALLRGGWTSARLLELENAAVAAARARACRDPRTLAAVERARTGFAAWARLNTMRFDGGERAWVARRVEDSTGWRLVQDLPGGGAFGLQALGPRPYVALMLPHAGAGAPATAEIILRDTTRARAPLLDVPGRRVQGLRAGAPTPAIARHVLARNRTIETSRSGARRVVFAFPDTLLAELAALDPREAAEVRVGGARMLIEIGDLAAARAFLSVPPR